MEKLRLIDADALRKNMYHVAFETVTPFQKWDSGCWIRYKLFENCINNAPIVEAIPLINGKWKAYYHGGTNFSYSCDQCGAQAPFYYNSKDQMKTRYCYNCGARMDNPKLNLASLYGKCVTDGEEI